MGRYNSDMFFPYKEFEQALTEAAYGDELERERRSEKYKKKNGQERIQKLDKGNKVEQDKKDSELVTKND